MEMCAIKKKGFTLVELSVVLVILGLIIGTLAPLMISMIKKDKTKDAKTIVKRAKDEIIGYVMTQKKLPQNIKDLGHYKDSWGNRLFLIVAADLKNTNICSKNSTNLSLLIFEPSGSGVCNKRAKVGNIAFIVGSKGPDFNRQVSSVRMKRVISLDYGCKGDFYPKDNRTRKRKRPFDDLIEYVTLNELKGSVCNLLSSHSMGSTGNGKPKPKPKPVIKHSNRNKSPLPWKNIWSKFFNH